MNPLSMLFGAAVALRNALYDRRVFRARRLDRPVVSIGNISVGGSGKTPFVIALGELLRRQGIAFDVLSRGYGRSSSAITVVDPAGTREEFGDEPLLIARALQAPVIVGADRYQAGRLAETRFPSRLHLLDDGFQHRRLHRDYDIVLLPREDAEGALLPVGRLREPLGALRRADAVVLFEPLTLPDYRGEIWPARRDVTISNNPATVIAFCGIAHPGAFFRAMQHLGQKIAGEVSFADHHHYRQADIDRLLRLQANAGADGFVTTEKDLVNLGSLAQQLRPLRTASVKISLEAPEQVLKSIGKTLENRSSFRL